MIVERPRLVLLVIVTGTILVVALVEYTRTLHEFGFTSGEMLCMDRRIAVVGLPRDAPTADVPHRWLWWDAGPEPTEDVPRSRPRPRPADPYPYLRGADSIWIPRASRASSVGGTPGPHDP